MTHFEVIEGGGKTEDEYAVYAQQDFATLLVEIFRTLVRGNAGKVTNALIDFRKSANQTKQPLHEIVSNEIREMHEHAFGFAEKWERPSEEIRDIVMSALRLAADMLSDDGFAKARISKSENMLESAIREKIRVSESNSRKYGWSYVARITDGLPPIEKPTPSSRKQRKSKNSK